MSGLEVPIMPHTPEPRANANADFGNAALRKRVSDSNVGCIFYSRLFRLWRLGFPSLLAPTSLLLYFNVLLNMIAAFGFATLVVHVIGSVTELLLNKKWDVALIVWLVPTAFGSFVVACSAAFSGYIGEQLRLRWRESIMMRLHDAYFRHRLLYASNILDARLDNLDQRVTQDVEDMTLSIFNFAFGGFAASGGLVYMISLTISLSVLSHATGSAGFLGFLAPIFIALVGITGVTLLMRPVSRYTYMQNGFEGSFRFAHARLREFSECVVFYGGQDKERQTCDTSFRVLYNNTTHLLRASFFLSLFQAALQYSGPVLGVLTTYLIAETSPQDECGRRTLNGVPISLARVQSLLSSIGTLILGFSETVRLYSTLGPAAGFVNRVGEMFEVLEEWDRTYERTDTSGHVLYETAPGQEVGSPRATRSRGDEESPAHEDEGQVIEARGVALRLPAGGPALLPNVNLRVEQGRSLIIMGPSGCGKSSLLRLLAGMWPVTEGVIRRPKRLGRGGVLFLPQRPYLPLGSFRDQIAFPHSVLPGGKHPDAPGVTDGFAHTALLPPDAPHDAEYWHAKVTGDLLLDELRNQDMAERPQRPLMTDVEIQDMVRELGLEHLLELGPQGLDEVADFEDMLSGGEMQRLGFLRLFYHRPRFAIMDEATSALDVVLEAKCMRKCSELGITCISVAHRPTLLRFHQDILEIDGSGGMRLRAVSPEDFARYSISEGDTDVAMHNIGHSGSGDDGGEEAAETQARATKRGGSRHQSAHVADSAHDASDSAHGGAGAGGAMAGLQLLLQRRVKGEAGYKLDWAVVRQFRVLLRVMMPHWRNRATLEFLLFTALSMTGTAMTTQLISTVQPKLVTAIVEHDNEEFENALEFGGYTLLAAALVTACAGYIGGRFVLSARYNATRFVHEMYFRGKTMFAVNRLQHDVDLDQRLCSDMRLMLLEFSTLINDTDGSGLLSTLFRAVAAAAAIVRLPDGLGVLVVTVFYCVLVLYIQQRLARPIPAFSAMRAHKEGDLRLYHSRVREFAESISFYKGERTDKRVADYLFETLITTYRKFVRKAFPATWFGRFNITTMPIIGLYILTASIAFGAVGSGVVPAPADSNSTATNSTAAAAAFDHTAFMSPASPLHVHTGMHGCMLYAAPGMHVCTDFGVHPLFDDLRVGPSVSTPEASAHSAHTPPARLAGQSFSGSGSGSGSGDPKCKDPAAGPKRSQAIRDLVALLGLTLVVARALRELPTYFPKLAVIAGYTHRVTRLVTVLEQWDEVYRDFEASHVRVPLDDDLRDEAVFSGASRATLLQFGGAAHTHAGTGDEGTGDEHGHGEEGRQAQQWWEGITRTTALVAGATTAAAAAAVTTRRVVEAPFIALIHLTCRVPGEREEAEEEVAHGRPSSAAASANVAQSLLGEGAVLLRDVSLRVRAGDSVIITGPSGAGKSSLLRVIGGIWPFPEGAVARPAAIGRGGVFFVPQRPYIIQGSLREQAIYPDSPAEQAISDDELISLFHEVGLSHLLDRNLGDVSVNAKLQNSVSRVQSRVVLARSASQMQHGALSPRTFALAVDDDVESIASGSDGADEQRLLDDEEMGAAPFGRFSPRGDDYRTSLDAVADWANMLSGGEMQRLGFVRLFYQQPRFAIMDEATSALNVELEAKCMRKCIATGITCISVAHRPTLKQYHRHMLQLDGQGGHRFVPNVNDVA